MTNSANEPLPVDHDTAINDDAAEFDSLEPSAERGASSSGGGHNRATADGPSDAGGEHHDPEGADQFGTDPQELQGDDPASGGS